MVVLCIDFFFTTQKKACLTGRWGRTGVDGWSFAALPLLPLVLWGRAEIGIEKERSLTNP